MKLSENWIREWAKLSFDSTALAETLTMIGLEVDGVAAAAPELAGVLVAEVIAVTSHPDASRLSVCEVACGDGAPRQVVCGAPNVHAGMYTAYAPPGVTLPEDKTIAAASIRGVESAGMLCSAAELGLGDDADGIMDLGAGFVAGQDLVEALALKDHVIDIALTPNRGDCFSVLGVARDLAAADGGSLEEPVVEAIAATCEDTFPIELSDPQGCPRYAGRVIRGVNSRAITPAWMSERLRRSAVRCIHPLVDVTNYVMLELGQPMHAFDFANLNDGIIVRTADDGEALELLDGQTITLDGQTLVIADHHQAVALAGVMGGAGSAVSEATVDVFLEAAFFDPIRLAGVARQHRMQTDASTRFERGVDPTQQVRAIERATELVLEICGGEPGPTCLSEQSSCVPAVAEIEFDPGLVNRLLGTAKTDARIETVLRALKLQVTKGTEAWQVTAPPFRPDIALPADLVEEVARIDGYDSIPIHLPRGAGEPALPPAYASLEAGFRQRLIARGYFEAITYSFIAPRMAELFGPNEKTTSLANPISSEMAVMRTSLWPGLVDAAQHNLNRQVDDVRLFEIGQIFPHDSQVELGQQNIAGVRAGWGRRPGWTQASEEVDFYDIKQDVESILSGFLDAGWRYEPGSHPALHPGQSARIVHDGKTIGCLGALHPRLATELDLSKKMYLFEISTNIDEQSGAVQYQPISRLPSVRRDISVIVEAAVSADACLAAARRGAGDALKDLQLFDVYRGQGIDSDKKSLSLGLIFQDASSTLTEQEVEAAMAQVIACLFEDVGGRLRD